MTLSFYYFYKYLDKMDYSILRARIKRLYFPQVAWAVIYWVAFMLMEVLFQLNRLHGIRPLFWQMLTGHSKELNPSMWYQFVLIVLTVVVSQLAIKLKGIKTLPVMFVLCIISVVLQMTGVNVMLFDGLIYELKYPLGRLAEMVPYVFLGLIASRYQIVHKLTNCRLITIIIAVGVMLVSSCLYWNGLIGQIKGFSYAGCFLFIMTICLITIAFAFSNEGKCPKKIRRLCEQVTQYTLGIYCMHRLVGEIMKHALSFLDLEINTFLLCIIIYAVSYCISYVASKILPISMQSLVN